MTENQTVAVVTGGSGGIGSAIIQELKSMGQVVINFDLNVGDTSDADLSLPIDISSSAQVARGVSRVVEKFECIDVLVNNAGSVSNHIGWQNLTVEDWENSFRVNLLGTWNMIHAAAPTLEKSTAGRVVNVSSIASLRATPDLAQYAAMKSAMNSVTSSMAQALAPKGVTVNAVCPGFVWTDMWRKLETELHQSDMSNGELEQEFKNRTAGMTPLGRDQSAEDIAALVGFLVSPRARFITGQIIAVDGGVTL